jgi:hypothetical protein
MTDLLISLIKIEDRYFPVYQAVDRPLRPTVATMQNSARCAQIELITAVC